MRSERVYFPLNSFKLHFPAARASLVRPHQVSRYVRLDPALCLAHSQHHRSVYKAEQRRKEDGWVVAARDCK